MEKYIHEYLTENYFPYPISFVYNLYLNDDIIDDITKANGNQILKELKDIYGLEKEESKLFIYTWAVKLFPDVNLDDYWESYEKKEQKLNYYLNNLDINKFGNDSFGNFYFPIIRNITASTLANDLVSIQPLSAPKAKLMWLDFIYEETKISRLQKLFIFIKEIPKIILEYLHISNYNNTFVRQ